jgi:hypothetical protein
MYCPIKKYNSTTKAIIEATNNQKLGTTASFRTNVLNPAKMAATSPAIVTMLFALLSSHSLSSKSFSYSDFSSSLNESAEGSNFYPFPPSLDNGNANYPFYIKALL